MSNANHELKIGVEATIYAELFFPGYDNRNHIIKQLLDDKKKGVH
jgi:hypothetical protein